MSDAGLLVPADCQIDIAGEDLRESICLNRPIIRELTEPDEYAKIFDSVDEFKRVVDLKVRLNTYLFKLLSSFILSN